MIIITGAVIMQENKILMVQEGKKNCYKKWNVPSGHLNKGEDIIQGAIREVHEETGLKINIKSVIQISQDRDMVIFTFLAETNNISILEQYNKNEILDIKWMDIKDIKIADDILRNKPFILSIIDKIEKNQYYSLDILRNLEI